jgi:hypothetical protein
MSVGSESYCSEQFFQVLLACASRGQPAVTRRELTKHSNTF